MWRIYVFRFIDGAIKSKMGGSGESFIVSKWQLWWRKPLQIEADGGGGVNVDGAGFDGSLHRPLSTSPDPCGASKISIGINAQTVAYLKVGPSAGCNFWSCPMSVAWGWVLFNFFRAYGCFSCIFGIISKVLLSKCFNILVASNYSESLIQSVLCLCSALPQRIKEHPARLTIWKTSRCQIKETTDEINNKDTQDNLLYCTGTGVLVSPPLLRLLNGKQVRHMKAPHLTTNPL